MGDPKSLCTEKAIDLDELRALREAEEDEKAGRIHTYEEVFGHPPLRFAKRENGIA